MGIKKGWVLSPPPSGRLQRRKKKQRERKIPKLVKPLKVAERRRGEKDKREGPMSRKGDWEKGKPNLQKIKNFKKCALPASTKRLGGGKNNQKDFKKAGHSENFYSLWKKQSQATCIWLPVVWGWGGQRQSKTEKPKRSTTTIHGSGTSANLLSA